MNEIREDWWPPKGVDATSITKEEADAIAGRAAKLFEEQIYRQIGRSAVRLLLYLLGAAGVYLLAWLGIKGKIQL